MLVTTYCSLSLTVGAMNPPALRLAVHLSNRIQSRLCYCCVCTVVGVEPSLGGVGPCFMMGVIDTDGRSERGVGGIC